MNQKSKLFNHTKFTFIIASIIGYYLLLRTTGESNRISLAIRAVPKKFFHYLSVFSFGLLHGR